MSDPLSNYERDLPPMRPEDFPDPNGEPVSLTTGIKFDPLSFGLGAMTGGAGLLVFGFALLTPAVGATRSARLMREQRQQEVAEAIIQFEASQSTTPSNEDAAR